MSEEKRPRAKTDDYSKRDLGLREKHIENYLKTETEARGGKCIKLVGYIGIPDRLLLLPGGRAAFVECKAPGEKPRPMQLHWLRTLQGLGFVAVVIDSKPAVREFFANFDGEHVTP